jgi:hypothetical protein
VDLVQQIVKVEWLGYEAVSTTASGVLLGCAAGSDDKNRDARAARVLPNFLEQGQSVSAWHFDVQQDQVGLPVGQIIASGARTGCANGLEALILKGREEETADRMVILDDKHQIVRISQ